MTQLFNSLGLSFLLLICLAGCSNRESKDSKSLQGSDSSLASNDQEKVLVARADTISIVAVGDIMLGSSFPSEKNLRSEKAAQNSFGAVDSLLKGDVVFGNLEGVLLDGGTTAKIDSQKIKTKYAFRMPERYGSIFKEAGFNLLSTANNHIGDFGYQGRKSTARILDSLKINYAGLTSKPSAIFTVNNVRYGFCAFAPNANTVSINDLKNAKKLVKQLRDSVDIVIVSFHGGGEGAKYQQVPKSTELFYKENRGDVHQFAHGVIDAGADVVLGHGPHVTRAVEVYKNKFIAYSLGNFCTYGTFSLAGPNGFAPILRLKITKKGNFISADVVSVKQDKRNGLTLDKNLRAFNMIKSLTDKDFIGHGLSFGNNTIKLVDLNF